MSFGGGELILDFWFADLLRCYYNTQRAHNKNWMPLWHFLLDTSVVNAGNISHCTPDWPSQGAWEHASHKRFHIKLPSQTFERSERLGGGKPGVPLTHYLTTSITPPQKNMDLLHK